MEANDRDKPKTRGNDKRPTHSQQGGGQFNQPADQAEGERGGGSTQKVGHTAGQAEGERDPQETKKK